MSYSVLMSVYAKEKAENLDSAMESVWVQSVPTNDFVLVCYGELTPALEEIIQKHQDKHPDTLNIIRLDKNSGLGVALNRGLDACKNEIVMRADSDDISLPERASIQLDALIKGELDIVSAPVTEFQENTSNIVGTRSLPTSQEDIYEFCKTRSPFNHPSVMYKKDAIAEAGGYMDLPFKEDYYLWVRMILNKCKCANISQALVMMRVGEDMLKRRKNHQAYLSGKFLFNYMYEKGLISKNCAIPIYLS